MPRPNKTGLDYFPLDVNVDDKIKLIEAKHGLLGFGLIIKLLQGIYRDGYYFEATEDRILLLKKDLNVDYNFILEVINDACKWKLFSADLFEKNNVLTSHGIQRRYIEATKRRKDVDFVREYLLVDDVESLYKEEVNVNINSINEDNNHEKDDSGTQSKVKKRRDIYTRVVTYLNRKTNSKFRPGTKTTKCHIDARLKEGFEADDFKTVIDFKCSQWLSDPEKMEYLRPQTLFGTKFESYLNAAKRKIIPLTQPKEKTQEQIDAEIQEALS